MDFDVRERLEFETTAGCRDMFYFDNDLGAELDLDELSIIDKGFFIDAFAAENLGMVSSHVDQNGLPYSGFGSCYNGFLSGKVLNNSMFQVGQFYESDIEHIILAGGIN